MTMDEMLVAIKRICEVYIKNADSEKKGYSSESWWSGYHTGQKKLAESILNAINGTKEEAR